MTCTDGFEVQQQHDILLVMKQAARFSVCRLTLSSSGRLTRRSVLLPQILRRLNRHSTLC